MKILFVCHRFPFPPERGGKIRPFNMIRWLGSKHQVTVVSIARSPQELERGAGLGKFCHHVEPGLIAPFQAWVRVFLSFLKGQPLSLGYFYVPELHQAVQRLLRQEHFDLIWVHCSSAAQYVLGGPSCSKVMDFGDMDSAKWFQFAEKRPFPLSLIYWTEGKRLRAFEKKLAQTFDECTVIAPRERDVLESYRLEVPVTVIPNGVDLEFFRNDQRDYDPNALVFLGRMDYYPNIDGVDYFCREILPLIRAQVPETMLTIVGSNPARLVRRLGRLPGVKVTGAVPDVRPYVRNAAVSVVPLRLASGIQNKVLESMAMRVPVVSTSKASQGVDVILGEHLLVDDSPQGFADKTLSLMTNRQLRKQLTVAARHRLEERHSWQATFKLLDQVISRYEIEHANSASLEGCPR